MKLAKPTRTVILIWLAWAIIVIGLLFDLLIFPTGFFLAQVHTEGPFAGLAAVALALVACLATLFTFDMWVA
jgi:hypothetical protein